MTRITHHHLTAKRINDESGPAILLEQQEDGYSEPMTIVVHPWQLKAVCEHLGLIAADQQATKAIASLQRRMLIMRDRIDGLGHNLATLQSYGHEDLSDELAEVRALNDVAKEWCREFESPDAEQTTSELPAAPTTAPCQKELI